MGGKKVSAITKRKIRNNREGRNGEVFNFWALDKSSPIDLTCPRTNYVWLSISKNDCIFYKIKCSYI